MPAAAILAGSPASSPSSTFGVRHRDYGNSGNGKEERNINEKEKEKQRSQQQKPNKGSEGWRKIEPINQLFKNYKYSTLNNVRKNYLKQYWSYISSNGIYCYPGMNPYGCLQISNPGNYSCSIDWWCQHKPRYLNTWFILLAHTDFNFL